MKRMSRAAQPARLHGGDCRSRRELYAVRRITHRSDSLPKCCEYLLWRNWETISFCSELLLMTKGSSPHFPVLRSRDCALRIGIVIPVTYVVVGRFFRPQQPGLLNGCSFALQMWLSLHGGFNEHADYLSPASYCCLGSYRGLGRLQHRRKLQRLDHGQGHRVA